MSMNQVVVTDGMINAAVSSLNSCDQANFFNLFVNAAEEAHNDLSIDVNNQINVLRQKIENITINNDVFNDIQLGDIESILVRLINTEGMQSVLNNACVSVGGKRFTIASAVEALASAVDIKSWEMPQTTACEVPTRFVATLDNDVIQTFIGSPISLSDSSAKYRYVTENWNNTGLQAGFDVDFAIHKKMFPAFGKEIPSKQYAVKKKDNLVFDMTDGLTLCGNMNTDVDLNNDGIIGRPDIVIDDPVDPPVTTQPAPQLTVQRSVIAVNPLTGEETIGYIDGSTNTTYETFPEGAILVDHNGVPVPVSTTETSSDTTSSSSTTTTTTTTTTSSGDGTDFSDVLGDPNAGATGN
jgi:hypothetical protein